MNEQSDRTFKQADCGEPKPYLKPTLVKGPLLSKISAVQVSPGAAPA